jgi:hypothetical protein
MAPRFMMEPIAVASAASTTKVCDKWLLGDTL